MIRVFQKSGSFLKPEKCFRSTYRNQIAFMSSKEVRKSFIAYFEQYDHINVPSAPVVPEDDPTLLFVNAGMNQFKSIFLGGTSSRWANIPRIVNSQKCIRAGGKHNDLDDVGKDFHHQTFFEMLGNWSFNNSYGKEAACELAFNYLTYTLKIDPERLYYSYFGGNKDFPADLKCRDIWLKLGIPASRVLPFEKENFWEMGSVGPCGPSTEIHFDRVGNRDASALVNKDDSVVEIWNIVFMQMNRAPDNRLNPLPHLHIDTGMGLERLLSVLQDVPSNYDTDLFVPLFEHIKQISGTKYSYSATCPSDISYRLIADHLRAVAVCLADGASFGPDNRGFVMRKMLRRACWNASKNLRIDRGFTSSFVPIIVDSLGGAYPELKKAKELIERSLEKEENQFWTTIDKSKTVFNEMLFKVEKDTAKIFSGENAWKLHDTYGLPIDVTEDILNTMGLTVDKEAFRKLQNEAKKISKRASSFSSIILSDKECNDHCDDVKYNYTLKDGIYSFPSTESQVIALFSSSNRVSEINGEGSVILKECQFYATEGGQKHDEGVLLLDDEVVFEVKDVRKVQGVSVLEGVTRNNFTLKEGAVLVQKLDENRRLGLMRAHTGTHLINWALKTNGIGTGQKGSSVDVDNFRFDYGATGTIDMSKLKNAEEQIKKIIGEGLQVKTKVIASSDINSIENLQSDLREISLWFFELHVIFLHEKQYPDELRVCAVGPEIDSTAIAVECCSGTHVRNTSSLINFVIMSDKSAAKGIRRIQVVTGRKAEEVTKYSRSVLDQFSRTENNHLKTFINEITWNMIGLFDTLNLRTLIKKRRKGIE